MGLCGCHLQEKLKCSNGIHDGKSWHRVCINISRERQKICRIVAIKIRGKILCSGELGGLCCRWKAYHQNLDMIDEMKHLPGTWIWKPFTIFVRRRPDVCSLCLVTAAENVSVQFVFWILGPLSKTCLRAPKTAATWHFPLLQKRLPLILAFSTYAVIRAVIVVCLYSCDKVSSEDNIEYLFIIIHWQHAFPKRYLFWFCSFLFIVSVVKTI